MSLNHPLAANSKGSWRTMRKLQYVFMALAALCFAIPAFADGGSAAANLVPIGAGLGMGLAAGLCGLGQGRAVGSAVEAVGPQPRSPPCYLYLPGSRSGPDRVPHPVHPGHRLHQDVVRLFSVKRNRPHPRIRAGPISFVSTFCLSTGLQTCFEYPHAASGWPAGSPVPAGTGA